MRDATRRTPGRIEPQGFVRAVPAATRDGTFLVVAVAMLVAAAYVTLVAATNDTIGFDFRGTLWEPAVAIREGRSPYPSPVEAAVEVGNPALYPPLLPILVTPLTALPWTWALTVWTLLQVAAIVGALAALRVRDVRCYVLALASIPVVAGITWGNATLLIVPVIALAWRWRDRWARTGLMVGLSIAAKLFAWPLIFWFLGTRRYRSAAVGGAAAMALVVVPWAVIGFDGLSTYPDLLRLAEAIYGTHSFSLATTLAGFGVEADVANRGALVAGLALAGIAFFVGRRGADEASLSLAILAAILGSPIVWEYYYALLLVPLAIARPRFSGLWLLLGLFYVSRWLPRERLSLNDLEPGGVGCCKPDGVPLESWLFNHGPSGQWPAVGYAILAVVVVASLGTRRARGQPERATVKP